MIVLSSRSPRLASPIPAPRFWQGKAAKEGGEEGGAGTPRAAWAAGPAPAVAQLEVARATALARLGRGAAAAEAIEARAHLLTTSARPLL